jgi:chromosome segregation ATPase
MTTSQKVLMQKFFDSISARVKQSFSQANRDVEAWQKVVMAPIEAQIREHKNQLKNRMQSIQRIHVATDSLEEKITSFEAMMSEVETQKKTLETLRSNIQKALSSELSAV